MREEALQSDKLKARFAEASDVNGKIRLQAFKSIVQSKNPFFIERLFKIFDKNNDDTICWEEFLQGMRQFASKNQDEKVGFLFQVYDINGDGIIQKEELERVMKACLDENGVCFDDSDLADLAQALFEAITHKSSGITLEAFKAQLNKQEGLMQNLSITIDRWLLAPNKTPKKKANPGNWKPTPVDPISQTFSKRYLANNLAFLGGLFIFASINLALFISSVISMHQLHHWKLSNLAITLARATGRCLNFNSTFILLVVLRRGITKLRELGAAVYLPLDKNIYFHKLAGRLIFIQGICHTCAHLTNYAQNIAVPGNETEFDTVDWFFTTKPQKYGLIPGIAFPTGFFLLFLLCVIVVCSLKWVRQGGYFEAKAPSIYTLNIIQVFYFSHLLYVVYWLLLILHAPVFWKWFVVPGLLFVLEQGQRLCKGFSEENKTWVSMGVVLPSQVTSLVIRKPSHFNFKAGDYIFLNIPSIAFFEWHPFTISSAPEQPDYFSLHIRAVGHWTEKLYQYFTQEQERLESTKLKLGQPQSQPQSSANAKLELLHNTMTERVRKTSSKLMMNNASSVRKGSTLSPGLRPPTSTNDQELTKNYRYLEKKPSIILYEPPVILANFEESESIPEIVVDCPLEVQENNNQDGSRIQEQVAVEEELHQKLKEPLVVYINGPFGAPASNIFRAEHAVLIGAGIGITPFASILQSIMHRYWKARQSCPKCDYKWTGDFSSSLLSLKKVDFFWINRDQKSFEWFVNLLSQLEIEQAEQGGAMEQFLDMHMYMTSAQKQGTSSSSLLLQMALEILHKKSKKDLITGLKTRTNAGRPDWNKVFQELAEKKKGKVTVFYCGSPQLGKILHLKCDQFGFDYVKENF